MSEQPEAPMQKVAFEIWGEQNDKTSRVMVKIGDDKPITLIEVSRALAENSSSVAVIALSGDGEVARSYVGVSINFDVISAK